MRKLRPAASGLLALALICPNVAHATTDSISQGDRILFLDDNGKYSACTAGYVDHDHARIWTAGHCAPEGSQALDAYGNKIGKLKQRYAVVDSPKELETDGTTAGFERSFFHDASYVVLNATSFGGTNAYSGDRTYAPKMGDKVCVYGATTKTVNCSNLIAFNDLIVYAGDLNVNPGDSGGPAWVPGKGYIGQILGAFIYEAPDGGELAMSIIHREDLAEVVPQRTDHAGFMHHNPDINTLGSPPDIHTSPRSAFGSDLPTASEYARIVREHQLEMLHAEATVAAAEERINKAEGDVQQLRNELNSAREELARLKDSLKAPSPQQPSGGSSDGNTGIIIGAIVGVLGVILGAAGMFLPQLSIPGLNAI
ncbi:hypothetical protein CPHO_11990 [Corynebacterium phocae]|uniref:Peptidase S1 domain-containing protein n=1 Tax=Corynebacterium phocae TaxID=161895 RepID=A0A1L7D621_9CORY|nr:hypothetical protein [Corynebacterium phocae]APT93491.1 hypothetical protein CPHO_11990 [Corynebacterium phocae]KAA8720571.1 hypothetical protein F4V58_11440 [Corynebacterium phocae]